MLLPFFEGIIAAIGSLILELAPTLFGFNFTEGSLLFLFFGATVEETVKFIFIYNRYLKLSAKERILPSAILLGLGFALTELFLKQLPVEKNLFLPVAGIFLVHISTTLLLGLLLRKNRQKNRLFSFFIVLFNIFMHFSYNLFVLRYL